MTTEGQDEDQSLRRKRFQTGQLAGTVSFIIGLTPVTLPTTPSDQFDIEISYDAILFEKKSDRLNI